MVCPTRRLVLSVPTHWSDMRRIKAAIVGLGYWGPNLLRNLQISADFDVVGGCDTDPERLARATRHHPGLACYSSLEALLGETRPELLVIATPVASHYSLVLTALQAGCHILCENPLAATVREARDLIEAAKRAERFVF